MAKYHAKHAAARRSKPSRKGDRRDDSDRPRCRHRGLRVFGGTVAAIAVLSGTAYGAGMWYFRDHFLPNTTVNGRDVSLKEVGEVASEISSSTDDYEDTVSAGDFSLTLHASDIDLRTDGDTAARDALSQVDLRQWPYLAIVGSDIDVEQGISFDSQKLSELVRDAVEEHNASAQQPEDATWSYDSESGTFQVEPEVEGDVVEADAVVAAVTDGVGRLAGTTECDDALAEPARRSDDKALTQAVDTANAMISESVPLTYQGKVEATVGRDQLAKWVSIDDDLDVTLDEDAVASYVSSTVAPKVNTEDDDNKYTVSKGELTTRLASTVEGASGQSVEIPVTTTKKPKKVEAASDTPATTSEGSYDSGLGSYVDVDLSSQFARLYDGDGNVVWSSNIVSGNSAEDRSTPTGTYSINSKSTDVTLVGADEDGDGEPDYKSHVTYWMPFIGNSIGLHDATWRGSFGGSIYETNGSHGCVNLPYAKASQLYDMVSVGTTVRVHY